MTAFNYDKISIIISTYNAEANIAATLESLSCQKDCNFNVFIQDGLSTDRTIEICKNYLQIIPELHICSEKDSGIYHAWNKVLVNCYGELGEWVIFLGAGDVLVDELSLHNATQHLLSIDDKFDYCFTPVEIYLKGHCVMEQVYPSAEAHIDLKNSMCIPHQGAFHRKRLFSNSKFSCEFKIAGDYEFLCRTLGAENYLVSQTPFVQMLFGGISSSLANLYARNKEFCAISQKYFPGQLKIKLYLRLIHSFVLKCLCAIGGNRLAEKFADLARILLGKQRLWTLEKNFLKNLPDSPSIDLLVATIDRTCELERLLNSLREQTYKNFRVIIADQNPEGFLKDTLDEFSDLNIKHVIVQPAGVSSARNAILEYASGDIVAFPDDDCWYDSSTLECIVSAFHNHRNAGTIIGNWTNSKSGVKLGSGWQSKFALFKDAETYVQFYRSEIIKDELFDEKLGPGTNLPFGCGEDTDFLLRIAKKAKVWRTNSVLVFHPVWNQTLNFAKIKSYANGRMYLLNKHNFSIFFKVFNILYPLFALPKDIFTFGMAGARYRYAMFVARLDAFVRFLSKSNY